MALLAGSATGGLVLGAARADTLQMSADAGQSGWYPDEAQLAPSAVAGGDFGQLFDTPVEGQVYAQPLVSHGVVLVATEDNDVYGVDETTGQVDWTHQYDAPWDPLAQINCGDLTPTMGITGTPVIDPATGVAYFVTDTADGAGGSAAYYLQALDVATGATPVGWPGGGVEIEGAADDDPGTVFDGQWEAQRPGLVLVNGVVYAAFGSHCDYGAFTGWLVGVSTATARITTMWASETGIDAADGGGGGGGIWQSGAAPVVDSDGDIFLATGNGTSPSAPTPGTTDLQPDSYAEAVVELGTSGGKLHVLDWFVPDDAVQLNGQDGDLGAGGPMELPASMATPQEPGVLLEIGKSGELYALDMAALGGYEHGPDDSDAVPFEGGPYGGVWSKPAAWPGDGGYVYILTGESPFVGGGGYLQAFQREVSDSGAVWLEPVAKSQSLFGYGSGIPVVTSEGTDPGSALVWVVHDIGGGQGGATLQAYAADPEDPDPGASGLLQEVWSSGTFTASKYSEPAVDGGEVFVGTSDGTLLAFGSLPASPPAATGDDVVFPATTVSEQAGASAVFTASAPTTVESLSLSPSGTGAPFALGTPAPSLPTSLAAGQQLSVPLTFTPQALGGTTATLTATLSGGGTVTVTVQGQGVVAVAPVQASPGSVDFAAQPIGGPPASEQVTFTNESSSALDVTAFELPALPFSVPDPPAVQTLQPQGSLSFTVDFSPPGSSGDFDHVFGGVATIETAIGDFGVPLSGSADPPAQLSIDPSTLPFGNVELGASETLDFDIGDQGGLPLRITSTSPPASGGFSAPTTLTVGQTIGADSYAVEQVRFTPESPGSASASWVVTADDGSGPQTLTLTGSGVSPSPGGGGGGGGASGPPAGGATTVTLPPTPAPPAPPTTTTTAPTTTVPPRPVVAAAASRGRVAKGVASVALRCARAPCSGHLELSVVRSVRSSANGEVRSRRLRVDLGARSYRIDAGSKATVVVRLAARGRQLLAGDRLRRLVVNVEVTVTGGATRRYRLLLTG